MLNKWILFFVVLLYCLPIQANQGGESEGFKLEDRPEFRAVLVPKKRTTLAAGISARIKELNGQNGTFFTAGDALVVFNCDMFHAQLNKAQALLAGATEQNQAIQRLAELKSVGGMEAKRTANEVAKSKADVAIWQIRIKQCRINAPFSGRVGKVHVREYQHVTEGEPLVDILDHKNLEMEIIVPSRWISWLKNGTRFNIRIDETQKSYPGKITLLGAEVNALNQSIRAVGKISGYFPELMPGMSGSVIFNKFAKKKNPSQ
ncbi:MAG: efflux RND transporter periplasmic adaptor subunit [Magnetococcales bacterium]|nr:efflux RND transporter periplasmic adaptor subunit [Magnetococcales bacterium]